ncbi:MAG TPA: cyclic nucleotide-binding domain-containing protein [Methylomirabilota bacterium]
MTNSEAAKLVRTVLCRGLNFEQTEQIMKAMVAVNVEAGAVLYHESEKSKGLFVLLDGAVEILKREPDGSDRRIATVEAPTVVGEMSLLTDRPHSATVRALSACEGRLLTRAQFERLLQSESLAAYKVVLTLADVIAKRLNKMDEKVMELTRQAAPAPHVEEFAEYKQKLFNEWM